MACMLDHAYFSGSYASISICEAWQYRMRIAYGCGVTVVMDLWDEFLSKVAALDIFE